MDINQIITEQEYNGIRSLKYEEFRIYIARLVKLCVEESLKSLPTVVQHLSKQISYLKTLSEEFYKHNKDLKGHRKLVAELIEKNEAEHPGYSYDKILELAAKEARVVIARTNIEDGPGRKQLTEYDRRLDKL